MYDSKFGRSFPNLMINSLETNQTEQLHSQQLGIKKSFPTFDNGNGNEKIIPNFWGQKMEWNFTFPSFGDRNGNDKFIPSFQEWEWEAGIPGNGREQEFPLNPVELEINQN